MTANITYALNPEKGTTRLYQTAVHLDSVETAWAEMKATKERWDKTDGIQGFHLVQSFAPGEVAPELAHRIGVELVERCFPGYEAVVGTHLDRQHIHNHIVLNSVSFLNGRKYHSSQHSYYSELREASDDLCRKYSLSVIQPAPNDGSRKSYAEWQAEQRRQPTWCSAIRTDVDAAIAESLSFDQFVRRLRTMGYEVKTNVKYMAVRPPGKERFTRLRRLGDDYTEEALHKRILQNDPQLMPPERALGHGSQSTRARFRGSWSRTKKCKVGGLRGLYLWYAFRMGNVRRVGVSSRKTHYLLREDIRKLEKRDRMAGLLVKNHIETFDQLHVHRDECNQRIKALYDERARLGRKERTEEIAARLVEISGQLKTLRQEVKTCNEIETDSVLLAQKRAVLRSLNAVQSRAHGKAQRNDRARS